MKGSKLRRKPMKKKWKKPELQVLIRGKIEESVLCHCKTQAGGGQGYWGTGPCTQTNQKCSSNNPS